ncbi:DUF4377 domain-containing protein [Moraxella nasovis]|uniref:DUF4377 domain-containing protein n=1 Tax=Moraxella nasovis TaxID=2904121 RepID=UPI001F623516|nr:DUF4377 domain-containing protein [Moraxella nasovis]UNU73498.1 DUF4377 domain-containing protein [Moraxella nasovis]
MKKLTVAAIAGAIALTGCATNLKDTRNVIVEGEVKEVKIQNISSFEVEIAPRKAVCDVTNTAGVNTQVECLQYRRPFDRNFNVLSGDIEGFNYEDGYRYVLDVKQTSVVNSDAKAVQPVWSLNKIISKTAEIVQ